VLMVRGENRPKLPWKRPGGGGSVVNDELMEGGRREGGEQRDCAGSAGRGAVPGAVRCRARRGAGRGAEPGAPLIPGAPRAPGSAADAGSAATSNRPDGLRQWAGDRFTAWRYV
jgi:hypothetical protein